MPKGKPDFPGVGRCLGQPRKESKETPPPPRLEGEPENHEDTPSASDPTHALWPGLTEHGHELLGVEVPVAPVGPVAMQRGVLLVVVCGLCPEGVNDPDSAPAPRPGVGGA